LSDQPFRLREPDLWKIPTRFGWPGQPADGAPAARAEGRRRRQRSEQ